MSIAGSESDLDFDFATTSVRVRIELDGTPLAVAPGYCELNPDATFAGMGWMSPPPAGSGSSDGGVGVHCPATVIESEPLEVLLGPRSIEWRLDPAAVLLPAGLPHKGTQAVNLSSTTTDIVVALHAPSPRRRRRTSPAC